MQMATRLRRWWHTAPKWFDLLELAVMHGFARLLHRCTGAGEEHIPSTGPCLIIANHPSHADPAFLIATCPRPLGFMQAKEFFEVPLLRWLFARVGCIPVARNGHDAVALRIALRWLAQGRALALFPQGDLSPMDPHETSPPKQGAAYLALRSRVPVIPALIRGGPRHRKVIKDWIWPSPGVHVRYGSPIDLSGYAHRTMERKLLEEVSALLMQHVAVLATADSTANCQHPGSPSITRSDWSIPALPN